MSERFQILSLDGGGYKGIFSAAILAYLEDDLKTEIIEHFDLIVGTSTGGIIALGLGLGMRPKDIVDFYVNHGRSIFKHRWLCWLWHWIYRKYSSKPLEKALRSCFGEKKRLLTQICAPIVARGACRGSDIGP